MNINKTNEIIKKEEIDASIISNIVLNGDLSKLSDAQKVEYYVSACKSLGLNPASKPFQLINFQGKQILYATKDATEQLRKIHGVSITKIDKLFQDDLYIVTVMAEDTTGRQDAATGVITIGNLKGDAKCNAIMKAETKAKRRVTLSICGLGILDDSETDTIGNYKKIDITTGEVIETKDNKTVTEEESQREKRKEQIKKQLNEINNIDALNAYCNSIKEEVKSFHDHLFSSNLREITKQKIKEIGNKIEQEDINQ